MNQSQECVHLLDYVTFKSADRLKGICYTSVCKYVGTIHTPPI